MSITGKGGNSFHERKNTKKDPRGAGEVAGRIFILYHPFYFI